MTKTVQYQNELHKFLIWDTAGQERVNTATIITKHTHTHTNKLFHFLFLQCLYSSDRGQYCMHFSYYNAGIHLTFGKESNVIRKGLVFIV